MKKRIILSLIFFTCLLTRGQIISGNCSNGYGVKKYSNGTYSGNWMGGKRHGTGTYSWNSGDKYIGEWAYGRKNGKGTFSWNNGDNRKIGIWKNGEETGEMKYIHVQRIFNSNAIKRSNSYDSDDFSTFEMYDSFECEFKLFEDKVVIDGKPYEIDRIISESGIFSKTIHIKLVPYLKNNYSGQLSLNISIINIYSRCSEMIVDYDRFGEVESIKTNHYMERGFDKEYFWRKHVKTSSYFIKSKEENNKVKW